ncbi:recombination regulator RecX, partial [Enterobacter hormaechei]
IRQELNQKGVARESIEKAMRESENLTGDEAGA